MCIKSFLISLFLIGVSLSPVQANHIIATIDEDIITQTDLHNRLKMLQIFFRASDTPESRKKLEPQVLDAMVDELVGLHAAKKYKLKLTDEKITKALASFAQQRGMTPEKVKAVLKESGIPYSLLENQLKASVAMNQIVHELHGNMLQVTDAEVDRKWAELQKAQKNQFERLVTLHQIAVPLGDDASEEETQFAFGRLEILLSTVRDEKSFLAIPKENSDIQLQSMIDLDYDAIHPQLLELLKGMHAGKMSEPMLTPYGATVLFWAKDAKKKITIAREEVMEMLYSQKLDKATKLALKNLKRDVYIDLRV